MPQSTNFFILKILRDRSSNPRVMNDQISVCPHTTLNTPNSRYIFRDFECCLKCVALNEIDINQIVEGPKFGPPSTLAKWINILCKKRK